jgi:hypothetical protein
VAGHCPNLFGPNGWRWRVVRTSNAYKFNDVACDSENKRGTETPDSDSSLERAETPKKELDEWLAASLAWLGSGVQRMAAAKRT